MDKWNNKVALISSIHSTIGEEIAVQLMKKGIRVVGLARREISISEFKTQVEHGDFYGLKCDVTKEDDILSTFEDIKKRFGGVDILINNLGSVVESSLLEGNTQVWKQIVDVNLLALCIITREAVKSMCERNVNGYVFNLSFISNGLGADMNHLYSASKTAIKTITENLHLELGKVRSNIKVTHLSHGIVKTNKIHIQKWVGIKVLQSEDVAQMIVYLLSTPPHVNVTDVTLRETKENGDAVLNKNKV